MKYAQQIIDELDRENACHECLRSAIRPEHVSDYFEGFCKLLINGELEPTQGECPRCKRTTKFLRHELLESARQARLVQAAIRLIPNRR